ncbi:hypothetical protein GQ44DRAFT_719929 [Phaeosphaeriaceae sp. PMI808]|nr:hypothetical protein GQ44DRAFT_719929 [Phaeosphaeriaceae sp. PMI808]
MRVTAHARYERTDSTRNRPLPAHTTFTFTKPTTSFEVAGDGISDPAEFASWPTPNYVNPETRRPLALAVVIPMTALVVTFMSCRLYSRTVIIYTLGWGDSVMFLASLLSVSSNIMLLISTLPEYKMGYHLCTDVPPKELYGSIKASQMGLAQQLLFTAIITLMKIAILLTYLRIFPSKTNKWFCRIMLFYTISFNGACFFVTLFQCSPVSTYWEIFKYIGKAKCLNIKVIYYFHSAQNTFSDFVIFLWPAKELFNIQISLRQRVTLISMFSLGVIVCIAGVARLYFTHTFLVSYDAFWHGANVFIIMSVESGVGVACGCLPGCKPLMNKMFPRIFATTHQSSSYRRPVPLGAKQLEAGASPSSSRSHEQESFHMELLRTGVVVAETPKEDNKHTRPPPTHRNDRNSSRLGFGRSGRSSRVGANRDDASDASTEFIILQRASEDRGHK